MIFDSEVILDWANKQKEELVAAVNVLNSVIYPNPLYESNSLFEPLPGGISGEVPRQHIIQGDNLSSLHWLATSGQSGKISLIYIDPPYLSQKSYNSRILLVDGEQKEWLQRTVFKDSGSPDLPSYLNHLYQRLVLMRELLSEQGSIFVHLDWHACHYVKVIMDQIFGRTNFINEIVWCYTGGSGSKRHFHRKHDTILWYSKGQDYTFHPQFRNYSAGTLQRGLTRVKGDRFHLHEEGAMLQDWWTDINKILSPTAYENLKFPTQKPVALLRRLIECASDPGDLVADFYGGSGTMAEAAELTGRDWISCDNNSIAIKTMIYRLLEMKSRNFCLDLLAGEAASPDLPGFNLYGPYLKTGGSECQWLEIGIDEYIPHNSDRARLELAWAWPVLIDYWEIDSDYNNECFRSNWQVIRRQHRHYDPHIPTRVRIPILNQASNRCAVRVHDIFGRETLRTAEFKS